MAMTTESVHGWLLKTQNSGDTSVYVTLFSRERGVLRGLYKGGRTLKKQSILQAFIPLWVSINIKGDFIYIQKIEALPSAVLLEKDALFAGIYINELISLFIPIGDVNIALFNYYEQTLNALSSTVQRHDLEVVLRRFERVLLNLTGYSLSWALDVNENPIVADKHYQFCAGEGFSLHETGILGAHLLAFDNNDLTEPGVLKAAKYVMRCAIDYALEGKPIKARSLYAKKLN